MATAAVQCINRTYPSENYTKYRNEFIRTLCRKREKQYFILLAALTCSNEIELTTESIAAWHGMPVKTAYNYCNKLAKEGYAKLVTIRDEAGRIVKHLWAFYDRKIKLELVKKPPSQKRESGPKNKPPEIKAENPEKPPSQKREPGIYYKETTKKEKTNNPVAAANSEKPARKTLLELRNQVADDRRNKITIRHIEKLLTCYKPGQVKTHIKRLNSISDLRDPLAYFMKAYHHHWRIEDADEKAEVEAMDKQAEIQKVDEINRENQAFLQDGARYDKIKERYLSLTPDEQRALFKQFVSEQENSVLRRVALKKNRVSIVNQMSYQKWLAKKEPS